MISENLSLRIVLFRVIAVLSQIGISVLIIKAVPLDMAGRYYTLATLAYVGSALVFIGADLYFQKIIIKDRVANGLNLVALMPLIGKTVLIGASISVMAVLINGVFASSQFRDWKVSALACGFLSAGMFVASVFRNISLGKGLVDVGTGGFALEQSARFLLILVCVFSFGLLGENAMIIASGVGSMVAGLAMLSMLKGHFGRGSNASYPAPSWGDVKQRFLPIALSALLNLIQLQGYRIIIGDWLGDQVAVGQVATLSVLGLSGAAGVLGLFSQLWLSRVYHGDGADYLRMVRKGAQLVLVLAIVSAPVGFVFLHMIDKPNLVPYAYLIPLGALVEGGNFLLGIIGSRLNASSKAESLWIIAKFGMVGVAFTYAALLVGLGVSNNIVAVVAVSLFLGQASAVIYAAKKTM